MNAPTASHSHTEAVPAPSGEATVLLDIGGDCGAAIVFTPSSLEGQEIEIRPSGESWAGVHTGVRPRHLRDGVCYAAVFGTLAAGEYQLRVKGSRSEPVMSIGVTGGSITEDRWPPV
jgi:hypothetical protein